MRIIICVQGVPHPTHGASTVLFYQYLLKFRDLGFQILNILLLQRGNYSEEDLQSYIAEMSEPGKFEVAVCYFDQFILTTRISISFSFNYKAIKGVSARSSEFNPDVILYFDLLSAWGLQTLEAKAKVTWLGDLNFQTTWYHAWYAANEHWYRCAYLPLAFFRCRRWRRIYRDVLSEMDRVIVSSKSSEYHLKTLGISSTYLPYPWPNASHPQIQVRCNGWNQKNEVPTFLFFGTLSALGSRSAFRFLLRKLYPQMLDVWGSRRFAVLICGIRELPDWVKKDLEKRPEFQFLGFVDDLDSVMGTCHAVLAPIDVPVGNRSRIVTAMAKGALVIAHKNVSLGNPNLVHGKTCYLADTEQQFVECMRLAVTAPEQTVDIIKNAKSCYESSFRPDIATALFVNEILKVAPNDKLTP